MTLALQSHLSLSSMFYALGYLTGVGAFSAMAVRRRMDVETLMQLLAVALVSGLVGAFAIQWIVTGQGGRTILGGFATGYLCVALFKKWKMIDMATGDLFAVAMSAGEAVGRWGCFFGGCC